MNNPLGPAPGGGTGAAPMVMVDPPPAAPAVFHHIGGGTPWQSPAPSMVSMPAAAAFQEAQKMEADKQSGRENLLGTLAGALGEAQTPLLIPGQR